MIYISQKTMINMTVAEKLARHNEKIFLPTPEPDFKNIIDTELTIIDLTADGTFQDLYIPKSLAEDIDKWNLPASVQIINILVSDINDEKRLTQYCKKLEICLAKLGHDIPVKALVSPRPRDNFLFIVPPNASSNLWSVYEIPVNAAKKLKLTARHDYESYAYLNFLGMEKSKLSNYQKLLDCTEKKLLWTGEDIFSCDFIEQDFYKKPSFN